MISHLVTLGADINLPDNDDQTAFMHVAFTDNIEMARYLRELGANVNLPDNEGKTALIHAALEDRQETAEFLIELGAKLDVQDKEYKTAIIYTILNENTSLLRFLLEAGANMDLQDINGMTPLMHACNTSYERGSSILTAYLANTNLQNNEDKTALMISVLRNDIDAVKRLVRYKTNLQLQDNSSHTAISYAVSQNYTEIIRFFAQSQVHFDLNPDLDLNLEPDFFVDIPVKLQIDSSVPVEYIGVIYTAADEWERDTGISLFTIETSQSYGRAFDLFNDIANKNMIYWSNGASQFFVTDRFAKVDMYNSSILINGDHFTQDVFRSRLSYLNYLQRNFFYDSDEDYINHLISRSLKQTMKRELGHILGLRHNENPSSIMFHENAGEEITAEDIESVQLKYNRPPENNADSLMNSAMRGDLDVVRFFIVTHDEEEMELVDFINFQDIYGRTALSHASDAGHHHVVEFLAASGADIHLPDINGTTPFMYAALKGHIDIMTSLIELGADTDSKDNLNLDSLIYAALSGRIEAVNFLVSLKVNHDLNQINYNNYNRTVTDISHTFERNDNLTLIINLEDESVLTYNTNDNKETKTTRYLEASLAYLDLNSSSSSTHPEELQTILNSPGGNDGMTLLMYAASRGHNELVEFLISGLYADPNLNDDSGKTAITHAEENGHITTADLIRSLSSRNY